MSRKTVKIYKFKNPSDFNIEKESLDCFLEEQENSYKFKHGTLSKELVENNPSMFTYTNNWVSTASEYYDVSQEIRDVKEFRKKFNLSIDGEKYDKALHRRLIKEEFDEFLEAFDCNDYPNTLKEFADIKYVIYGYFLDIEISHYAKKMWLATKENNLAKLGKDGKPMYREDGKLMKPKGFKKIVPSEVVNFDTRTELALSKLKD